jgi:hypothetical protein
MASPAGVVGLAGPGGIIGDSAFAARRMGPPAFADATTPLIIARVNATAAPAHARVPAAEQLNKEEGS